MIQEVTKAIRARSAGSPKSVLGFYATMAGLVLGAVVMIALGLVNSEAYGWLVPWTLGFAAVLVVAILAGVFLVSINDPSKLMLTHVSGSEYAEIQKHTIMGSSVTGERLVPTGQPEVVTTASDVTSPYKAIEAPDTQQDHDKSVGDDNE